MKHILILGAGQSAPSLIRYLLEQSAEYDWKVTVADLDVKMAESRVDGHPNGTAISFNVNDAEYLVKLCNEADLVVNMLAPMFQDRIAEACLEAGTHMVSASYQSPFVAKLHNRAIEKNVLILNEMGLDPGIDHMSAMATITRIKGNGGRIKSFCSYGSGVPATDSISSPFKYVITWNPKNVAIAGQAGAQYLENGKIKIVPAFRVFERTWPMPVEGVGVMEAYPNRDSLVYIDHFKLENINTMIRGTLRYPGYSETWLQIVRLGLPNDSMTIPNMKETTWAELTEMFLPEGYSDVKTRTARYLGLNPTGAIMDRLEWLGLFSNEKTGLDVNTAAGALTHLLQKKLPLEKGGRDMVILLHRFEVEYPETQKQERIISTFVYYGTPDGETGMAQTVGLPAAIAVKRILTGDLNLKGCLIPIIPDIYEPILAELDNEFGIRFVESVEKL